jgi:hypothetical protein
MKEVIMKIKKKYWSGCILVICLTCQGFAQPYYYYTDKYGHNIWRFDFQVGIKTLFYTDSINQGYQVSWDPTQTWVFLNCLKGNKSNGFVAIDVINGNNPSIKCSFPIQSTDSTTSGYSSFTQEGVNRYNNQRTMDGIIYNPMKNTFYVTWFINSNSADTMGNINDFLSFQRTALYDASSFSIIDSLQNSAGWITSVGSVSVDGNYLYLENWDYYKPQKIGKYSSIKKQLVINRNISEIVDSGILKEIQDNKKGYYLLEYISPGSGLANKKYVVYNIDNDNAYAIISFSSVSHGCLSGDGKYVIIEETPLKPDYKTAHDAFLHPGRISVFNGITGQLIKKLTLPPDGKVLVFDNYPNMLYYYLPKQNRSINIDLSKLGPTTCTVKLLSSADSLLNGGSLQYRDSTWKDATNNNDGTFTFATSLKKTSLRMTYAFGTQTKSNVTIKSDSVIIFKTNNVIVNLQSSQGNPIDTGTVQYYEGGWKDFGATSNGVVAKELLPIKYTFKMAYKGSNIEKAQNIDSAATIIFQTKNVSVNLQNSQGNPLDTGTVQYNAGGWQTFGNTLNGVVTNELLPIKYTFRMTYNGAAISKAQNVDSNSIVIFQTVTAKVQLQTSTGAALDTGIVQYYAGGWQTFGITSNGAVAKELLPTKYTFRLTYNNASITKVQNIDSNATVLFQTVPAAVALQASNGSGLDTGIVRYYSGGWKDFGITSNGVATKELLPVKYTFQMTYNSVTLNKAQNIDSNMTIVFQTVPAKVQLQTSSGTALDTGFVQYYAGGWKDIGITNNGVVTKELLPVKYTFRLTYCGSSASIAQNVDSNATVNFSTIACTVSVTNSSGSLLNNAVVSYYAGGWNAIGATINGIVTKELLPVKIQFRAVYGTKQKSVTQDVSANPLIQIALPVQ